MKENILYPNGENQDRVELLVVNHSTFEDVKKKMECLDSLYEQIGMEALRGSIIWYGSPETETRIYFEEKLDTNEIAVSWYTRWSCFSMLVCMCGGNWKGLDPLSLIVVTTE